MVEPKIKRYRSFMLDCQCILKLPIRIGELAARRSPHELCRASVTWLPKPELNERSAKRRGLRGWKRSFRPTPVRWIVQNGKPIQTELAESPVMASRGLASGVAPTVGDRKDVNARSFRKTEPVNDGEGAGKAEPVA